jgi:large subunit ribosomal protein L30
MSRSAATDTALRVTQVRSSIGVKPKHRATLRALGLRGIGRSRVLVDSPTLRGMLSRVGHLVEVRPAQAEEAERRRRRSLPAKAGQEGGR